MVNLGKLRLVPLIALAWGWGLITPGLAAEQVKLRFGPLEQSVAIADLESFAETGELSPALRPYAMVLKPEVRQALTKTLQIDSGFVSQAVDELLQSSTGSRLLQVLGIVVQDTTPQQLQLGLTVAAQQAEALSLIGFLKAYPDRTITVDTTSALAVASQLNHQYLESQTLNPLLQQELSVPSSQVTSDLDPTMAGPETVHSQTLMLRDRQRQRTIPVDLYWGDKSQGPLVVMSHGFASDRKFMAYLARHLASYGLAVVALEHPGSNAASIFAKRAAIRSPLIRRKPLLPAIEFVERAQDVSFLLDELTKRNQQSGPLQNQLNTTQVTLIGHSLGGQTALALAGAELDLDSLRTACKTQNPLLQTPADWLQCSVATLPGQRLNLRDNRIAQVIAINPLIGYSFGEQGLTRVQTPTLVVSSTSDAVTPAPSNQLRPFAQLPAPKYLLTAIGATHLSVSDITNVNQDATLVKERLGLEVIPFQQLLQGISLAFIQQLTPQAEIYEPFLSAAYAQSLSTPNLPLRLSTRLPESIIRLLE